FLLVIDTRDSLGAPVDVNHDITSGPAPFVKRDSVYAFIVGLLDSAVADLAVGGSSFPFGLPPGFSGFTTPTTFTKFNRALKARTGVSQVGHPSLRTQADTQATGQRDRRFLNKVRTATLSPVLGHTSDMVFNIYRSNVASVPIIRNEELILLRAETEFGLGNQAGAAALINYIRVNSGRLVLRAGLNVAPADTVISQLLQQRVYSLLFEGGHRWIDA